MTRRPSRIVGLRVPLVVRLIERGRYIIEVVCSRCGPVGFRSVKAEAEELRKAHEKFCEEVAR